MLASDGFAFIRMILVVENDMQIADFIFLGAVILGLLAISDQVVEQKAELIGRNTTVRSFVSHLVQTLLIDARDNQVALRKVSIGIEKLREVQGCIQIHCIVYVGVE